MNKWQEDVKKLHQKYGHPAPDRVTMLTPGQAEFRAKLILEEALETASALTGKLFVVYAQDSKPPHETEAWATSYGTETDTMETNEAIDGLCDTIVVTLGTAVAMGIDLDPFMAEVQRANMAKERSPSDTTKWIKPEGWKPPDIAGVLREQAEVP